MARIITKEHDFYFTPTERMASSILQMKGMNTENADFMRELSRFFYHQMVESNDYIDDQYKIENYKQESEDSPSIEQIAEKIGFYDEMYDIYVPGYSPMEKAINALKMMKKAKKDKEGNPENMEEALTALKEKKVDKEVFECSTWNKLLNKRGLDEFDKKLDHLNKIAIIKGFGKTFEIKKTTEDKKVLNSNKFKNMRMSEFSESINASLYQRVLPNFNIKLATKDIIINTPISTKESKQKIIILVDFSGSMNYPFKQNWVLAILADRLYYAMKEECEIFFSFFIRDLYPSNNFVHIYNEETALKFFSSFNTSPSGGDTYIGEVIEKIRNEIMTNKKLFNINVDLSKDQPEILIINDRIDCPVI